MALLDPMSVSFSMHKTPSILHPSVRGNGGFPIVPLPYFLLVSMAPRTYVGFQTGELCIGFLRHIVQRED